MSDVSILILLYAVGVLMLVAEIFIPSHGILSVAGIGFLMSAVYKTFLYGGREAGIVAVFAWSLCRHSLSSQSSTGIVRRSGG